jgi:adenylate cyclase
MPKAGIRRWDAVAVVVIVLVAGTLAASPTLDILHGLSLDSLTALRWRVVGNRHAPAASPAVVIAFDEDSYRTPPFKGTPTITWIREIGRVVTAVVDGGALVVGFDVVFPTSIEESEVPFENETVGTRLRGFDRDFLRSLAVAARAGKVVLGEIQHGGGSILPASGQRVAVGQRRNIRALNVYSDSDDILRRVPLILMVDDKPVPAMALELASRALGAAPEINADQSVSLAGYSIPAHVPNAMALNFDGGANDIPTYSLADLRACLEKGDTEFFRRNFQGKVVLLGSTLDLEDRKMTSKRFATAPDPRSAERCAFPADAMAPIVRNSIAGVYVHATAINNLLRHEAVTELARFPAWLVITAGAALAAFGAFVLTPVGAALSFLVLALAWTTGATVAFSKALALPLFEPFFAGFIALVATTGFRLFVADKDKRFLRRAFALYLAPAVIEKMVASSKPPALGGEMRNVTVFFSDVAGFSSFSETMMPTELVALMNRYLSAMTDIIEEHGGFVDKYIGDSIVAVFGAPVEGTDHAVEAVRAALRCCAELDELNWATAASNGQRLAHRIGLNSGQALVGNIGSRRRFNYTVIGDSVNLASRLEGANKYFGTSILASEATMALTGTTFRWREIDTMRVKGRMQPVRVYEPLAEAGQQSPEQVARAEAYSQGLARWRERDFAGAVRSFASAANADLPSALFMERAKRLSLGPPGEDWEPINTLEEK